MINDKKIVFVGPSGTGKTSIKKTFFERYSPISLLVNPINPSRGITTSVYSLFNNKLGIFDLAGQENDLWLSETKDSVFNDSNMIICIFDIHNSVESIIQFILNIYHIQKENKLNSCHIVAFLHKADLVSPSYMDQKIKAIHDFVTKQHPRGAHFEIYKTSITESYYYTTFRVLSKLLKMILPYENILPDSDNFFHLKNQFSLLMNITEDREIQIEELVSKLKLSHEQVNFYINQLKTKGIIAIENKTRKYILSDNGYYYKVGLENHKNKQKAEDGCLVYEIFSIFLILDDNNS